MPASPLSIDDPAPYQPLYDAVWGVENVFKFFVHDGETYEYFDTFAPYFNLFAAEAREPKILVRREYVLAYDYLAEQALEHTAFDRANSVMTGQPGIGAYPISTARVQSPISRLLMSRTGKTLFQFYILLRRMQEMKPIAIQLDSSSFVIFSSAGVSIHPTGYNSNMYLSVATWAVSDSVRRRLEPCDAFLASDAAIIQTTSPASKHYKEWVKSAGADVYIMDVWEKREASALM